MHAADSAVLVRAARQQAEHVRMHTLNQVVVVVVVVVVAWLASRSTLHGS